MFHFYTSFWCFQRAQKLHIGWKWIKNDSTIQNGRDQKESYGENKSCYGVMQKYKIDSAICL